MRIHIANLISRLETDNPDLISALSNRYALRVPGYQFVPAYRNGHWDGKKRYFKADGTFRTGLLARIKSDLKLIGCDKFEVYDSRKFDTVKLCNVKNFKYRPYQEEAIEWCLNSYRGIIQSPTGSGKTLIMAGILKSLQKSIKSFKAVILFKEKGILTQTYEFFKECGIDDLGINFGEGFIHGSVMLSTVQSIEKIIDSHVLDSCLLMVDEVHQFGVGETTVAAIESFPKAIYRFGFTATPPTESADSINSRYTLEGAFGEVYQTRSMKELIEDGSIAKPIIQIIQNDDPTEYEQDLSYQEIYETFIVNSEFRNNKIKKIVETVYSKGGNPKILILVKNLSHIKNLKKILKNCYTVEGINSIKERYDIIDKFISDDKPATLIGTNVMQTGISIDEITHMINGRGLSGEIPTIQGLGRGVRKAKGIDEIYYYDFYDTVKYLLNHSKKRISHYKNQNLEINYVRI